MGAEMVSGYQGKSKLLLRSRKKGGLTAYLDGLIQPAIPHAS
jgi:hypothetical protein